MNKLIKTILIIAGIILIAYGGYKIFIPEASLDIGIAEFESQDNKSAFITLGIGILALVLALIPYKKTA